MKKLVSTTIILFFTQFVFAQTKHQQQVQNSISQLHTAMINADSMMLKKLTATTLSYGHSSGALDNKSQFIEKLISGKSDFVTINITEQTIAVQNKTAIVRHRLDATTNDNGKPSEVHLKVLQVWQKMQGRWKLIARQAVKI